MGITFWLFICLGGLIGIPILTYFTVKLGVLGFLSGKKQFTKLENQEIFRDVERRS